MNVVEISTELPGYQDTEGRIIIVTFETFKCVTVYAPNSGTNYDNKIYFMEAMIDYLNNITEPVVFCGDLNVAISTHFDRTKVEEGLDIILTSSSFIQIYKQSDTQMLSKTMILFIHGGTRGREKENGIAITRNRNKGWRLDYFFTKNFKCNQIASKCLKHIGENNLSIPLASDHAPVLLEIKNTFTEA